MTAHPDRVGACGNRRVAPSDVAGGTLRDPPVRRFEGRGRRYYFGFSAVGLSSAVLAVDVFGFMVEAAVVAFGCQKSAAT
jgi:hypothetical protein